MPFPNEHSARLADPGKFDKFRRQNDAGGPGVDFIYGISKGKSEIQAIRFDSGKFTVERAHAWLKKNNKSPLSFVPAKKTADKAEFDVAGGAAALTVPVATAKPTIQYMETPAMDKILKTVKEKGISADEFLKGMSHELEHTDNPLEQAKIALDHLLEHPNYYTKLESIDFAGAMKVSELAWDMKREDVEEDVDSEELDLECFTSGTHTDSAGNTGTWTEKDLENMANSYNDKQATMQPAPVVLGHPAVDGSSPSYGWIKSLRHVGDKLFAVLKDVNPNFLRALKEGSYKNRSLSIYDGGPKDGWVRHIGFLGATPPAITGLQPQSFQDSEKYKTFEYKESPMADEKKVADVVETPEMVVKERNFLKKLIDSFRPAVEKASKDFANESITAKEKGTAQPLEGADVDEKEKKDTGIEATAKVANAEAKNEAADFAKENAELKAQVATLTEQLKKAEAALANRENPMDSNRAFCESLVKDGKLRPADVEETLTGLNLRSDADKVKNFAEDSPESSVSRYKTHLSNQPKVVEFGEILKNHKEKEPITDAESFLAAKTKDRMALTPTVSYESCFAIALSEMEREHPKEYKEYMVKHSFAFPEKEEDDGEKDEMCSK